MTAPKSPTINLDQIINSGEWTLLESNEEIIEAIYYDGGFVPEDEQQTIYVVNERTGSTLIDKVYRMTVHDPDDIILWTLDGYHISPHSDNKIYLYTPPGPLPTNTGSKIYNVTVRMYAGGHDLGIDYLFDSLTLDRTGTWFGLDQQGELQTITKDDEEFLKITKFSLTPNKSDN